MKILWLLSVLTLVGCAQTQTVPVEVEVEVEFEGLEAPEFLKLTADDVGRLESALIGPTHGKATLSDGRWVTCSARACRWREGTRLRAAELRIFRRTLDRARVSGHEERFVDGWTVVRCVPERCAADLKIEKGRFKTQGSLIVEQSPWPGLAGAFLGGMIPGALTPRRF